MQRHKGTEARSNPRSIGLVKKLIPVVSASIVFLMLLVILETGSRIYAWYRADVSLFSRNPHPKLDLFMSHPYLISVPKPDGQWKEFSGNLSYSVNSLGFRGEEFEYRKPEGVYRIVALGGSTTWGNNVTDEHTYPRKLENILNASCTDSIRFEVINAGVPGYTSTESLLNLALRLLDLSPDMITIYHAYNDIKVNGYEGFKRDYSHYRSARGKIKVPFVQSRLRFAYVFFTLDRLNYVRRHILPKPDISGRIDSVSEQCIGAFKDNLCNMVYLARSHGIKVVLCTFAASLNEENLRERPEIFTQILNFVPKLTYDGLMDGFRRYNQAIVDIAEKEEVPIVYQHESMPPDFDLFVDHIHFTEKGTELFAANIAEVISRNCLSVR